MHCAVHSHNTFNEWGLITKFKKILFGAIRYVIRLFFKMDNEVIMPVQFIFVIFQPKRRK